MPPPTITLQELYALKDNQRKTKKECFDKVLEKCHSRIRNVAKHGGMCCFFEVPALLLGLPLFNRDECTEYIVANLRRVGFLVQILPDPHIGVIYISWNPSELAPSRPVLRNH